MKLELCQTDWDYVKALWEVNQHLASTVRPNKIEVLSVSIRPSCFIYKKDKVIGAFVEDAFMGCVRIEAKHYGHLRIAALGKMAVEQRYRKNGIATLLMKVACLYMNQGVFDVSVLWASVLALYEQHGYVAIHKNMMVKFLKTTNVSIQELRTIPETLGTW